MIKEMPRIALGTWEMPAESVRLTVPAALKAGYKHIDTAQIYFTEEILGEALSKVDTPREEYWLTSKVWGNNFKYHTYESVVQSLKKLQTTYIDTMLLHTMGTKEDVVIAYKELMRAREDGLVRFIGVSNFTIEYLQLIKDETGEFPKYNQVISSAKQRIEEMEDFAKANDITLMGYSSIRPYYNPSGYYPDSGFTADQKATVDKIAAKHDSSPAIVLLRYVMQLGYVILPKSNSADRVIGNFEVDSIKLDEEDMNLLKAMNNFSNEKLQTLMKDMWRVFDSLTEEDKKMGVRLSPESDAYFTKG